MTEPRTALTSPLETVVPGTPIVQLLITADLGHYRFGLLRRTPQGTWKVVSQTETARAYATPEDCLTSARHALRREQKGQ